MVTKNQWKLHKTGCMTAQRRLSYSRFLRGKETLCILYKKLQKLDEKTREVIYLRITGEFTFKEIGEILNKTENWARVTFYRGKEKLKEGD